MKRRRPQAGLWPAPPARAAIDGRPLEVGERVWCAGRPYRIVSIGPDGAAIAYDPRPQPPQPKDPRR